MQEKLHEALDRFAIDVIIAENCLAIPMNIPLGLAPVETVMETGIRCSAHHHDFIWKRERSMVNAVEKKYSIWDAYRAADFVTYPSTYEDFGNAFLETLYFKKPILCNRYAIYRRDIEPCGFDVILMDGFLTEGVVGRVREAIILERAVDSFVGMLRPCALSNT